MSGQSKISRLEKAFVCPICGNRFYSRKGKDYHKEIEHEKSFKNE
jgi:hypothetical protein